MKRILLLALITACRAKTEGAPPVHKVIVEPVTTDPWAAKAAPKVDALKDPDLAMMTELARGNAGKDSPQADAVIATLRDDFTLKPDGTVVHHTKSIVKLLDAQRAKEKFADVHLTFDGTKQSLVVDTARTVNSDGEAHVVSPDEIGDIVPEYLAGATIYSHVRERVISFPAVDKGSVIELETTRTTKPGPDSPMGAEVMIGRWDPIVDRTITVTAPAGTVPAFAGSDVKPTLPNAGLAKRKYPLWIGMPRIERGDVTVEIPAGWKVAYVPDKLEGAVDGVAYSSACEANGQTVSCHDEIKLDKLELDTAHYTAFHDALAKLQAYERRVVLLTKA